MKTPFVAHPPTIFILRADDALVAACKAAAKTLGIPVRVPRKGEGSRQLIEQTRPLVIVCDAASTAEDSSTAAELAERVEASVVTVHATEPTDALARLLQDACVRAEKKRAAAAG